MKIPQYTSEVNIKVAQIPELSQESVRSSEHEQAGLSAAIKKVGADFAEVEKARGDLRDFRQTNEASALTFEKLNAIKAVADEDIEFDPARYDTEIDNLGQEASKTITNQIAKEKFMADFQRQGTTAKWGIRNLLRGKELEATKASIEYTRQQIVNGYAGMTPIEQGIAAKSFKEMLVGSVKTGVYNRGTANQIDMKFQEDVQKSVVDTHILADPNMALKGLNEGKDGPYPGISDQFRTDSIEKANAYIKKYDTEAKLENARLIDANENDIVGRMIDPAKGMPTEGELVTLMNSGNISPRFAKAAVESIRSAKPYKPNDLESAMKFNELIERNTRMSREEKAWFNINQVSFNDIAKFRADVFSAKAQGYLSEKQMTDLLKDTSKTFYRDPVFQNTLDQLAAQSKFYDTPEMQTRAKFEMYNNLIKKVTEGKSPQVAVTEVIKEKLNTEIGEAVKTETEAGRIYRTNKKTKQRIYSEDGGNTWIDAKTNEMIK